MEITTEQLTTLTNALSASSRILRGIAAAPVESVGTVVIVIDGETKAYACDALEKLTLALIDMLDIMSGHVPPEVEAEGRRVLEKLRAKKKPG